MGGGYHGRHKHMKSFLDINWRECDLFHPPAGSGTVPLSMYPFLNIEMTLRKSAGGFYCTLNNKHVKLLF